MNSKRKDTLSNKLFKNKYIIYYNPPKHSIYKTGVGQSFCLKNGFKTICDLSSSNNIYIHLDVKKW